MYPTRFSVLVLANALAACGSSPHELDALAAEVVQPIVNGEPEDGWAGVGALTIDHPSHGYRGSFCTGTLVEDDWVLTAAHCLVDEEGQVLDPGLVHFYIGTDARPDGLGWPTGSFYRAGAFYPHPSYDDFSGANDIAMAWLAEPASGQPTYALNDTLGTSAAGTMAFYVGYGVNDGDNETGGGIKRSASIPIIDVTGLMYASDASAAGVCYGDSGGPGFLNKGGGWKIVGVNNSVSPGDGCLGNSYHARVDAFLSWIQSHISSTPPSCQSDSSLCACEAACQSAGWCDNAVCQTMGCYDILECMLECSTESCANACYQQGSPVGKANLNALLTCSNEHCASASNQAQCIDDYCSSEWNACTGASTGTLSCDEVYDCMQACGRDGNCTRGCHNNGTLDAQSQIDTLLECYDHHCGHVSNPDLGVSCTLENCATEQSACFGSPTCTDRDQDGYCIDDDCVDSMRSVHPDAPENCADGLDNDCDSLIDEDCAGCVDEDQDGYCATDDCNDDDDYISPAAVEVCFDAVDNDCDGSVDESCATCVDADGDRFCAEVDCDDTDAFISPAMYEQCRDGIDNNCNVLVDEGCDSGRGGGNRRSGLADEGCSAHEAPTSSALMVLVALALWRRRRAM